MLKEFEVAGRTSKEIETEIINVFDSLQIPTKDLMQDLHFEIPAYPFIDDKWEKPVEAELKNWTANRTLANEAYMLLLGLTQSESEIRIWPHHFDTGIYFKVKKDLGIGFGLAMKDNMVKDAYYYMAAYPENYKIKYENLPKGEIWKWQLGEHWNGAILPLKSLEGMTREKKENHLSDYMQSASAWMLKQ